MLLVLCRLPLPGLACLQAAEQERTNLQLLEEGSLLRQQLQERRAQLQQAGEDVHLLQVCSALTLQCSTDPLSPACPPSAGKSIYPISVVELSSCCHAGAPGAATG